MEEMNITISEIMKILENLDYKKQKAVLKIIDILIDVNQAELIQDLSI